jgi:ABC-2 type transport system ATP-binding protein
VIEARDLTKRYGKHTALQGLGMKAEPGSIFGLVGYNGAGKTTLLKCAIGMFRPEEGKVLVEGENVYDNAAIKRKMFFIPDELFFLPQASMERMAAFYRGFYPDWSQSTFTKLSGLFKLDTKARVGGFSKGMQRQAAFIFALSARPKYLLLDELFDGLDPAKRNLVRQLLLEAIAGNGMSVVISSHNLREMEDLCDRIGVINDRRIVYESSIEDLRGSRRRYRAIFQEPPAPEAFGSVGCAKLKVEGKVATFVARRDEGETDRALAQLSPVFVEKMPMTLEEIFLDEMEVGDYDFSGIFDEDK